MLKQLCYFRHYANEAALYTVICMLFICIYIINCVFLCLYSCFDGLDEILGILVILVNLLLIILHFQNYFQY